MTDEAYSRRRVTWPPIIDRARAIAESSSVTLTLRALFYRLVAEELLPNRLYEYQHLSRLTARERRAGNFPSLADPGRVIERGRGFASLAAARAYLASFADSYRRNRSDSQPYQVVLAVEKATLTAYLGRWFGDLGVPIVALRGYASQTYVDEVTDLIEEDERPTVLLYAGDFDPSGEDIARDFRKRVGNDESVDFRRVALDWGQVVAYGLPPQVGKATDARAAAFAERHGRLVQVELEALDPDVLERLFREALAEVWDEGAYRTILAVEADEREELRRDAS